jgi:hypothetical protein
MSQRTHVLNENVVVNLQLNVNLKSLSNHNGFTQTQIENAINEFKENIQNELYDKIENEYNSEEFVYAVDYVNYTVTK